MKQLTVLLPDAEMETLAALARAVSIDAAKLASGQLAALVAEKSNGTRRDAAMTASTQELLADKVLAESTVRREPSLAAGTGKLERQPTDMLATHAPSMKLAQTLKKYQIALGHGKQRRTLTMHVLPNLTKQRVVADAGKEIPDTAPTAIDTDADLQSRLAAASKILGLQAERSDTPNDGVDFKKEMRPEWQ